MTRDINPTPGKLKLPDDLSFHPCRPISQEQAELLKKEGVDLEDFTQATVDSILVYMLPEKLYKIYLE